MGNEVVHYTRVLPQRTETKEQSAEHRNKEHKTMRFALWIEIDR